MKTVFSFGPSFINVGTAILSRANVDCIDLALSNIWKKLHPRHLTWSSTSLRLYVDSLFISGMVLNLEFHRVYGYPEAYLGLYQISIWRFLRRFRKLVPRFSKMFVRFTWDLLFIVRVSVFMIARSFIIQALHAFLTDWHV